jgi:G:T-mismatch repair DNA endonuclease (very short patch repair protein)
MTKKKKTSKYRSGLEERVADLLDGLGITYKYESEKLSYTIEHNYTPDFVLPNYTYLETKGYWDAADRRKVLAVKKANPEIDLRMVFQSPYNTISKKSKTTYAKWCEKHDIPWTSFHNIPLDWLI